MDAVIGLALGGQHYYRCTAELPDLRKYFPAVHAGQHHIQKHQIRLGIREYRQRAAAALAAHDVVALAPKI